MPASQSEFPEGTSLAIAAEALYLINLMIAPGLAFVALVIIHLKYHRESPPIAKAHLSQTVTASLHSRASQRSCDIELPRIRTGDESADSDQGGGHRSAAPIMLRLNPSA